MDPVGDESAAVRPAKVSELIAQERSDTEETFAYKQRAPDFYQKWESLKTSCRESLQPTLPVSLDSNLHGGHVYVQATT